MLAQLQQLQNHQPFVIMATEDLDLSNKVIGSEGFDWSQLQDEEDLLNLKAVAKAKKHARKHHHHARLVNLGYRGCEGNAIDMGHQEVK